MTLAPAVRTEQAPKTVTMVTDVQEEDAYWVAFLTTKLGLYLKIGEGEIQAVVVSKVSNEECKHVI